MTADQRRGEPHTPLDPRVNIVLGHIREEFAELTVAQREGYRMRFTTFSDRRILLAQRTAALLTMSSDATTEQILRAGYDCNPTATHIKVLDFLAENPLGEVK